MKNKIIERHKKVLQEVEAELKIWETKKKECDYMVKERKTYVNNLKKAIKELEK